jgi:ABC-type transport system substrate-binding protein
MTPAANHPRRAWARWLLAFALICGGAAAAGPGSYDSSLRAHVRDGVVDYPAFQRSAAFTRHVADLAQPATLPTPAAQLAHWINAYNALAIQGILDGLSPSTLLGRLRYFKLREWPLAGERISLYDLEHKVLRPLRDPRIHFAIVCASRSCPALRAEAYDAERLDFQLDDQARRFINDPSRNRYDKAAKTAHLSEIFKWFDEDFAAAGSVQKYVARYVADPEIARGLAEETWRIEWIAYDWNLNGTPPRP